MTKYSLTSLVIILLLATAGGWWYLRKAMSVSEHATTTPAVISDSSNLAPTSDSAKKSPSQAPKQPVMLSQTYKSIITQTGNHRCDYDQLSEQGHTTGVVYIADGNMRAELRLVSGETKIGTLVVYDGRYLYTWKEGLTTGIKTQPASVSELPLIIPADLSSKTVLGSGTNSVSWNCHPWIKDAKILVPPAYVTFNAR